MNYLKVASILLKQVVTAIRQMKVNNNNKSHNNLLKENCNTVLCNINLVFACFLSFPLRMKLQSLLPLLAQKT
jgi:hypothetical protein